MTVYVFCVFIFLFFSSSFLLGTINKLAPIRHFDPWAAETGDWTIPHLRGRLRDRECFVFLQSNAARLRHWSSSRGEKRRGGGNFPLPAFPIFLPSPPPLFFIILHYTHAPLLLVVRVFSPSLTHTHTMRHRSGAELSCKATKHAVHITSEWQMRRTEQSRQLLSRLRRLPAELIASIHFLLAAASSSSLLYN